MRFTPRRSSPRLKSFDYVGSYSYHLVLTTRDRTPQFRDVRLVAMSVERLQASATKHGFEVLAYCFMPDHLHLLVAGSERSSLGRFVQGFKQATGFHRPGLWHRSFYDHVLRAEEAVEEVANYIWANPVRAGLVEETGSYPYSGPRERLEGRGEVEDRAKALSLR